MPIFLSSYENNILKVSHEKFLFMRYAYVRNMKRLFRNIHKQYNMLEIGLLFKKFTNFTGKQLGNSLRLRMRNCHGIASILAQTYRKIFKSALVYL